MAMPGGQLPLLGASRLGPALEGHAGRQAAAGA